MLQSLTLIYLALLVPNHILMIKATRETKLGHYQLSRLLLCSLSRPTMVNQKSCAKAAINPQNGSYTSVSHGDTANYTLKVINEEWNGI